MCVFLASSAIKPQRLFKVFCLYFQETPRGSVAHDRTTHRRLPPYFVSIWAPYYRLQSAVEIASVSPEGKLSRDVLSPGGVGMETHTLSKPGKTSHNGSPLLSAHSTTSLALFLNETLQRLVAKCMRRGMQTAYQPITLQKTVRWRPERASRVGGGAEVASNVETFLFIYGMDGAHNPA